MTRDEKLAYQRGYQRGIRWPEHCPPCPPDPVIARLMTALKKLRDTIDSGCAMFDPEDEFVKTLDPAIGEADKAMAQVTEWLKSDLVEGK